jgi:Flp pilus assembly protein TadG
MIKKFSGKEDGSILVLFAVGLAALIAMTGLVIDGGHLYMQKSRLQKTANASALSGAQEIPNSKIAVHEVVSHILASHGEENSLQQSSIENNSKLYVALEKNVPLFFATLFGVDSLPVKADAKAALAPMGAAKGAVPLGIDESVALQYGQAYQLKVDSGDSASGNFGVLALQGPGAKLYGESLTYGFDQPLKVGDIIPTQTGNIAGETRSAINYRIDSCPYPSGEYQNRDCPRVMLVIVYKPYEKTTTQLKSIKITGFAYFYVTDRMGSSDDSIKGIFIKRTGAGTAETAMPLDRGAYAVRLTE